MKTITTLFLSLLLSTLAIGQSEKIDPIDTIPYSSSIEAVTDTLPDINIFDGEEPMHLTLKYDITSFIRNKMKGEYLDAELRIEYKDYTTDKNIRLKARGNNRRQQCFFPPIFLNFKTDPIEFSELKGFKKVKLVTHCSSSKVHVEYLLREYLVYKLYNILTDNSFRVKLLDIEYIDTGKKERHYERFGVLIEPIELLAKRAGAIEVDGAFIQGENVFEADADLVALFNYMIGNTDWRFKSGHNMKYIKSLTNISQQVIPVPYDFDFSGFVGTHYAHPQEWTSIDEVKDRQYLGYCRESEADYLRTVNLFIAKKQEILSTIEDFEYLSESGKKGLVNYIEEFYLELKRPETILSILRNQCRPSDF